MDEGLDAATTADVDMGVSNDADINTVVDINTNMSDIPFEPLDVADETGLESNTEIQELADLQHEANTLNIEPFDDGVELGYNYDEAMVGFETQQESFDTPSTLMEMINAGAAGATAPSWAAEVVSGIIAPNGAEDITAQGLQAAANAAVIGAEGLMEAAHRQHAFEAPPLEGVDFLTNESGEIEPINQMISITDDNGGQVWVRPSNDTDGG